MRLESERGKEEKGTSSFTFLYSISCESGSAVIADSLSRSPQRRSHLSPCWLQKKKLVALTHIIFGPLLKLFLAPTNKKLAQENSQNYQQPKSQKEKIQLNQNHPVKFTTNHKM